MAPTAGKEQGGEGGEDDGSLSQADSQLGTVESFESMDSLAAADYHVVEHSPQGRYVRFNAPLDGGCYKEVWKAYDTSEGVEVAWNTLSLKDIPALDKKRIIQEIKVLEKLDHANIISFYTSWYNREQKQIVFITELMNSGSLLDFVKPVALRWKIVKRWAKQILEGLVHLHAQQPAIIHRNINCDNIFIVANKSQLKIGDLGLSTVARSENCVGTAPFMAPELYEEVYDEKVDIYAFGMTMLQMITKETPYSECENVGELYKLVTSHIPPEGLACIENENARRFIELCISPNPSDRPTAEELSQHPFLKENKEEDGLEVVLLGRPARAHLDRSEGYPLLRSDTRGSDTSMDSLPQRRPCLGSGREGSGALPSLAYSESGGSSSKGAPLVVSNGSKLHMRFFSEPPAASFSELSVSDEESDLEGLFSNDGSTVSKDDSHADEESLSRSLMRSGQPASHSPRSAWRAEQRVLPEEDDDLCDLPEAESTCKKVKVMGGRNAELEDDTAPSGPVAALPTSPVPPKAQPSPASAAPSSAGPPRSATSTPLALSPVKAPALDIAKNVGSGPTSPVAAKPPAVVTRQHSSESNQSSVSTPPSNESGHGRVPGSLTTVASYDISVRSTSESSDSSCASGPSSPIKSQTSTPPASPIAGGASRKGAVGITQEAMDVLQCISRQQQRQEQRQQEHDAASSSVAGGSSGSRLNVMTLVIRTPLLGKLNLVEFEFNLSTDDPEEVAREMVTELGIPETDMNDMASHIGLLKEKELARRAAKAEARSAPAPAEPSSAPSSIKRPAPVLQAPPPPKPIVTPAPTVKIPDKKEAPSPARPGPLPGRTERKEGGTPSSACASPTVMDSSATVGAAVSNKPPSSLTRRPSNSSLVSTAAGGAASTHARCVSSGSHMQRLPSEKHLLAHHHHQHSLPSVPSSSSLASAAQSTPAPPAPVSRSSSNESLLGSSKNGGSCRGMVSAASACSLFGSNPRNQDTDEELENLSLAEVETDDSLDEEEDELDEEYQKLKREYLKSRERCVKVFKQRMESMEQCWRDKEESHRKQLEKHQKLMMDFDRRQDVFRNEQHQREVDMEEQWHSVIEQHREALKARRCSQQQHQQQHQQPHHQHQHQHQQQPAVGGVGIGGASPVAVASASHAPANSNAIKSAY